MHIENRKMRKETKVSQTERNKGESDEGTMEQGSLSKVFEESSLHFSCTLHKKDKGSHIRFWAAANGGVTNGGLRGVWPPVPGNRPKSAFFRPFSAFSPFSRGPEQHRENPENGGKRPFSLDILGFA